MLNIPGAHVKRFARSSQVGSGGARASVMEGPDRHRVVAIIGLGLTDRDAVGLKPGQNCRSDIFGWTLEPCRCSSFDRNRLSQDTSRGYIQFSH